MSLTMKKRGRPSSYMQRIMLLNATDDESGNIPQSPKPPNENSGSNSNLTLKKRGRPSRYLQKIEDLKTQEAKWNKVKEEFKAGSDSEVIKALVSQSAWSLYRETIQIKEGEAKQSAERSKTSNLEPLSPPPADLQGPDPPRAKRRKTTPQRYNDGIADCEALDEDDADQPSSDAETSANTSVYKLPRINTLLPKSPIKKPRLATLLPCSEDLSPVKALIQNVRLPSNFQLTEDDIVSNVIRNCLDQSVPSATTNVTVSSPIVPILSPATAQVKTTKFQSATAVSDAEQIIPVRIYKNEAYSELNQKQTQLPKTITIPTAIAKQMTQAKFALKPSAIPSSVNLAPCLIDVGDNVEGLDKIRQHLGFKSHKHVVKMLLDSFTGKETGLYQQVKSSTAENVTQKKVTGAVGNSGTFTRKLTEQPPTTEGEKWIDGATVHIPYRFSYSSQGRHKFWPLVKVVDFHALRPLSSDKEFIARSTCDGRMKLGQVVAYLEEGDTEELPSYYVIDERRDKGAGQEDCGSISQAVFPSMCITEIVDTVIIPKTEKE